MTEIATHGNHVDADYDAFLARTNPHGKPLASAAAHHQLRHGASLWPF